MFRRLFLVTSVLLVASLLAAPTSRGADHHFDVVIYGGTSAGVAAGIATKRLGKSVVIVGPDIHLGGLTSGGLGWTDSGNKDAIGGISREFYHRVWRHYQQPSAWKQQPQSEFGNRNQSPPGKDGDGATMWVFEPHVAEAIFDSWVDELEIPVHRDAWLDRNSPEGVVVRDGKIKSIKMLGGDRYFGKRFIDATYEGDLMAKAGVDYHVGREANSVYDETWNGVQVGVLHHKHWFDAPISPYVQPGDPDSGLVWGVSDEDPGKKGEGDHRLQAYCFRMCLTNADENRIPFPKPEGYDAQRYELLRRVLESGWRELFAKFDPIPNYKTDTNNHGPFSTDMIGMNYDYPEASYDRRREIIQDHEFYQQGLMYFMANDSSVPADVREAMSKWGLAADEFTDNGHWPHQIYVREARRMIGEYVMTEHDCLDRKETPQSVGMGSYTLDSHNVQRYIKPDGFVQNEGDIGVRTPRPYKVAFGSIVPKKKQCENLLVPVCVSSSHIAFGSIRMEPVFMILGQSAATAACLSIDRDIAVQDLPYEVLREQLLKDRQVLNLKIEYEHASDALPGIVIDDRKAKFAGAWTGSSANKGFVDAGYQHNRNEPSDDQQATFQTKLDPGTYTVRISYPPNGNRATNTVVTIHHADGVTKRHVNQRQQPDSGGLFHSLGTFDFDQEGKVVIRTSGTDGYVIVDAVQFIKQ